MLCDDLRGGMRGGREAPEGIHVYVWLIHFVVQQKQGIVS